VPPAWPSNDARRLPPLAEDPQRALALGAPGYSGGMPALAAAAAASAAGAAAAALWSTQWSTPAVRSERPGGARAPRDGDGAASVSAGFGIGIGLGTPSRPALEATDAALVTVVPLRRGSRLGPPPTLGRMSLSGSDSGCATDQLRSALALATLGIGRCAPPAAGSARMPGQAEQGVLHRAASAPSQASGVPTLPDSATPSSGTGTAPMAPPPPPPQPPPPPPPPQPPPPPPPRPPPAPSWPAALPLALERRTAEPALCCAGGGAGGGAPAPASANGVNPAAEKGEARMAAGAFPARMPSGQSLATPGACWQQ